MNSLVQRDPTVTDPQLPEVWHENVYCPVEWLPANLTDVVGHQRRPRYVIADIAPATFLGNPYEAESVRLEVRFWYPAGVDNEYSRINWVEPERTLMLGFHQDGDQQDIGPCHLQLEYENRPVDRHGATFLDMHPLSVLDDRLQQLPAVLDSVRWGNGSPALAE